METNCGSSLIDRNTGYVVVKYEPSKYVVEKTVNAEEGSTKSPVVIVIVIVEKAVNAEEGSAARTTPETSLIIVLF